MRVLLVRLDGIGDAAVCTPLLAALRDAGHEVGVALTTRNAGLFAPGAILLEHVLERIPWPAHGSTPETTERARAEIAAQRYDVALIASEEPEAFALAAPIGERIGFTTGWGRPLKSLWVRARTTRVVGRAQRPGGAEAHEVEVLYRLGLAAGLVRDAAPSADPARLRPLLTARAEASRGEYVVLQAGAKWASSGVPDEVLAEIVARLDPYGVRVVAAPAEASDVRSRIAVEPETFADLPGWVALLDGARCVVTVDTGAAHVAGMLGTPVVDVFPDAHFAPQVRRWRPWAAPYRALRASQVVNGAGGAVVEAVADGI
jgi:ADP-heptose:LPS heptosyltransferase